VAGSDGLGGCHVGNEVGRFFTGVLPTLLGRMGGVREVSIVCVLAFIIFDIVSVA
jgi:phosphotransferase system  glucose/maltose/N-acetylglucosamine-specific IIC component